MCRKGRMFAPTKTWRKWHRKISKGQRRYATCSALAATAVPSLVLARGHRIENISEIPLVISNKDIDGISKTKEAVDFLKKINAFEEIERVKDSRKIRRGGGKTRNRRHVKRRGPLVIYQKEDTRVPLAFRNIPGIELCHVTRLNLLQLAPGGHLGRFIIWTEDAFRSLNNIFGTFNKESTQKKGWILPSTKMTNTNLSRIINSDVVQSALRPKQNPPHIVHKKNPLRNFGAKVKLNPFALTQRRRAILATEKSKDQRKKRVSVQRTRVSKKYYEDFLFAPQSVLVETKVKEIIDEGVYIAGGLEEISSEEEPVKVEEKKEGEEGEKGEKDTEKAPEGKGKKDR